MAKTRCEGMERPRYKYTVTVQTPAGTTGADGHIDLTDSSNWTTSGTIKANFTSKGGREFVNGERVQADVTHVIETPSTSFSRGILPKMRMTYDSRTFQIEAAYDVDEMHQVVRCHLKELV